MAGWESNKRRYERQHAFENRPEAKKDILTPKQFASAPMKHTDEYPLWPFIALIALAICWVISLTTSFSFSDSLLVGAVIILVPLVSRGLRKVRNRDAEELAEKLAAGSGQETDSGAKEEYPASQNSMKGGN